MVSTALLAFCAAASFLGPSPHRRAPRTAVRIRADAAQLTVERYGKGTCLHVGPTGVRRVCHTTELPKQPPNTIRIVSVSDTHSQLDAITVPPGDILLHTGDITFCARGGQTALADFNEQLRSLPHQHKVVIAGNHDKRIEQLGAGRTRETLTAAHYLENSGVHLEGLHFWGCPYSPMKRKSSNTAFQYNSERMRGMMTRVPDDVDVLLTHACTGSTHLRHALSRVRPFLHAHGHDHDEHGATVRLARPRPGAPPRRGPARLRSIRVNAAICNRRYQPVQLPVVVDLLRPSKPRTPPPSSSSSSSSGGGSSSSGGGGGGGARHAQGQQQRRQHAGAGAGAGAGADHRKRVEGAAPRRSSEQPRRGGTAAPEASVS